MFHYLKSFYKKIHENMENLRNIHHLIWKIISPHPYTSGLSEIKKSEYKENALIQNFIFKMNFIDI